VLWFHDLTKNQPTEPGKILSPDKLVQFYQLITMVFIVLGIVNFASQYFFARAAIASALLLSGVLIGLGIILQWSQQLPVRRNFKERILFLVLAASIPLIAIQNNDSNSFAIGAVPIVFIMLSVIYNKRRIMLWLGGSIILTQIWVWSKASPAAAISGNEHMVRLITYLIVLGLAFYINRIYILRLEENENQILFQKMVSRLSTAFSGITNANKVDTVNELFALSADYFQLDHAFLISFSPSAKQYEWIKNGSENCQARIVANEQDLTRLMNLPWQDDLIHIPNIQKFPGASTAKTILELLNNHSLLAIKVKNENDTMGILFFTSSGINLWRDEDIELLKIIANLASDVLLRIETENIINRLAYYDALTGLPNRTLFINRLEQAIHLAKRSEKLIGVIFIDLDCFKASMTPSDTMEETRS
jgi:GGDEF domain-containing protein